MKRKVRSRKSTNQSKKTLEVVNLDDSGYESIEAVDESFNIEDTSLIKTNFSLEDDDIFIVDDENFDAIKRALKNVESSAESQFKGQEEYFKRLCKTVTCTVDVYSFPIDNSEEHDKSFEQSKVIDNVEVIDIGDSPPPKKKPGRPKSSTPQKTKSRRINTFDILVVDDIKIATPEKIVPQIQSIEDISPISKPNPKKRKSEEGTESVPGTASAGKETEDMKIKNGEENAEANSSPKNKKTRRSSNESPPKELCEYEKIREQNIRDREAMLASLMIQDDLDEYKKKTNISTVKAKKPQIDPSDIRRSSRVVNKPKKLEDDDDYVPDERVGGVLDPGDHTHDGLRRHPCKECSNCLKKDCRKCIFCRDKAKYGGPNIKKQRCILKSKCDTPRVACRLCEGGQVEFPCGQCDEKFPARHLQSEHKEKEHGVVREVRKSSRGRADVSYVE